MRCDENETFRQEMLHIGYIPGLFVRNFRLCEIWTLCVTCLPLDLEPKFIEIFKKKFFERKCYIISCFKKFQEQELTKEEK